LFSQVNSNLRAVLLDIEGTTTPIDFVFKTLFPFASERVGSFLRAHIGDAEIQGIVRDLETEHALEATKDSALPPWTGASADDRIASAAAYARRLIQMDRKLTALKTLQGKIWEEGFLSGELRGELYPDVPVAFERWRSQGKRLAIFSSGSVQAQKLLFANSTFGDLTRFIEGYFDTTTGPKREASSYLKIASQLGLEGAEVLFVSDVTAELDAAAEAGMRTALSLRPGVTPPSENSHPSIQTLDELLPAV
jgi:enolase-phosphatase E1